MDVEAVGELLLLVGRTAVENHVRGLRQLPIDLVLRRTDVKKGSAKLFSTTGSDDDNVEAALIRFADLDTPSSAS